MRPCAARCSQLKGLVKARRTLLAVGERGNDWERARVAVVPAKSPRVAALARRHHRRGTTGVRAPTSPSRARMGSFERRRGRDGASRSTICCAIAQRIARHRWPAAAASATARPGATRPGRCASRRASRARRLAGDMGTFAVPQQRDRGRGARRARRLDAHVAAASRYRAPRAIAHARRGRANYRRPRRTRSTARRRGGYWMEAPRSKPAASARALASVALRVDGRRATPRRRRRHASPACARAALCPTRRRDARSTRTSPRRRQSRLIRLNELAQSKPAVGRSCRGWSAGEDGGQCGVPYNARFKMPGDPQQIDGWHESRNGTRNNLFYSFDVGSVHFVMLSSEHDLGDGSAQLAWLAADLAAVDRSRTPFVLVGLHRPVYTSTKLGIKLPETKGQQAALEPLLLQHRVSAVFAGHYHQYERSCPIARNACAVNGTVHVTAGIAGLQHHDDFASPGRRGQRCRCSRHLRLHARDRRQRHAHEGAGDQLRERQRVRRVLAGGAVSSVIGHACL